MGEKQTLAKSFCPIIRLHPKEDFTPTNFVELFRQESGTITYKEPQPLKKWKQKAQFDEQTGLNWYEPAIYVHFLENLEIEIRYRKHRVPLIIQYFFYFPFNLFYWGGFQIPFLNHKHDWEIIQVAIEHIESKKEYRIKSYSISAHGLFIEINDQRRIENYRKNGFHCNRGAHNFASIFYQPNALNRNDIIIKPETLVPASKEERIAFKDTIIFLDVEYERDFLQKFSFYPVIAPWAREFYDPETWIPQYWSWSFDRELQKLIRFIARPYFENPE